jgi:hypothetical protein
MTPMLALGPDCPGLPEFSSGGRARTGDLTIMSRAL